MSDKSWSWIGAKRTGTSHLRSGRGCDDAACCVALAERQGSFLISAVSDGAGSAQRSSIGARVVVRTFCRNALRHFKAGATIGDIDEDLVADWLDDMRDRISSIAQPEELLRRDYAATLVGSVIGADAAAIVHVGDGACAIRLENSEEWLVPSWPAQGEYAATTYFVTDDPVPRVRVRRLEGIVTELALFTDGLERLALDFGGCIAFAPFFQTMFAALDGLPPGRGRRLSRDLHAFLGSERVTSRTDDDATLILARRV